MMSLVACSTVQAPPAAAERSMARSAWPSAPALDRLADALEYLMTQCPDLPVLAIPWMSLRHPLHEVHVAFLRSTSLDEPATRPLTLAGRMVRAFAEAARLSVRLLWTRWALRDQLAVLRRQSFDLIAKSWSFGPTPLPDGRDFYYGDLQSRCSPRGVRTLLLCGDVRGDQWKAFVRGQTATGPTPRLPELCLASPVAPLRIAAQQLTAWWRLRRLAARTSDPLLRAISLRASSDCLTAPVLRAALWYWIGRAAVRRWRPRTFLILYEGHPWERCAWRGIRAAGFGCQVAGYQHTVLFRESLALIRPCEDPARACLPDVVLGLGPVPLRLMRERHAPHGVRLLPFGSFRAAPAMGTEQPADPQRRTILVTPEGIPSEVRILFAFAAACAKRLPSYTFILRSHPEISKAQVLALAPAGITELPNVVLSEGAPMEEDFARASVLMYRGSSTVLYAIAHGLLPLFVHAEGAVDSDPLYALEAWRECLATPEDVAEVLARHERTEADARTTAFRAAARFVADYTGPVTDQRLEAFVSAVGIEGTRSS